MTAAPSFLSRVFLNFHSPLVLWMVVCSFVVGGFTLLAPESVVVLWVAVTTLMGVAVAGLIRLITVSEFATPWSVLAVSFALGYGLGSFNTLASGYSSGMDLLSVTYAGTEYLAMVAGGVLMLAGMLLFVGELDQRKLLPSLEMDEVSRQTVLWLLSITFVLAVLAVLTGQLGFQADIKEEEGSGRVSVLGNLMASAMPAVVATGLYASRSMQVKAKWLTYLLSAGLMLILVTQGRRIFIYTVVMVIIGLFSSQGFKALLRPKNILILLFGALLVSAAVKMFFAMRQATYDLPKGAQVSELFQAGLKKMQDSGSSDLDEKLNENRSTRTFILGYAAELLNGLETHDPLYGDVMILGLAAPVPSVIWPGKWKILAWGSDEMICHPALGLPAWDAANSLITAGLCDFGWFGFFVYPLLIPLIYSLALIVVQRFSVVPRLVFGFALIYALLNVESVIAGYIVTLRNEVILLLFVWALHQMVLAVNRRNRLYAIAR